MEDAKIVTCIFARFYGKKGVQKVQNEPNNMMKVQFCIRYIKDRYVVKPLNSVEKVVKPLSLPTNVAKCRGKEASF